jgi:hypothetical protein
MKKIVLIFVVLSVVFFGSISLAKESKISLDKLVILAEEEEEAPASIAEEGGGISKEGDLEEEAEKKEEKVFSLSGEIAIFSQYVDKYTGEYISGGSSYQLSLTLTHNPTGLYISALGYISELGIDEVDLFLGKSTEFSGFTFDTGVGFYNIDRLSDIDDDFVSVYVGVDCPEMIGLIPFVYVEGVTPLREEFGGEGGWLWKVGAKKSVEISNQLIELKIEAGGNDGIYGSDPMLVAFARGTVSTKINILGLDLVPSIALQKGFGGIAETDARVIAGFAIAF